MKLNMLIGAFLFFSVISLGQEKNTIAKDSVIKKWMHAVINLECRPSNFKAKRPFYDSLEHGLISEAYAKSKIDSIDSVPFVYGGTAVFLTFKNRNYLVTARHVLIDTSNSEDTSEVFNEILLRENGDILNKPPDTSSMGGIQFINREQIKIYHLNFGPTDSKPFVLSSIKDDLAIINLDFINSGFVHTLKERGYQPISITDINTTFRVEPGQELFAFGFPNESIVKEHHFENIESFREEPYLVTRVAMSRGTYIGPIRGTNLFNASIFYYHGYSGGPVVSNNKLIGIISAYEYKEHRIQNQEKAFQYFREFNSCFIKSSEIQPLLKKLITKQSGYLIRVLTEKGFDKKHISGVLKEKGLQ